ncbi:MAG: hypothetical protein KQH63_13085 [Desulfobulbaceae bacterium]|nr:hypothetical protein [Desulfobulbaceae bacterium]
MKKKIHRSDFSFWDTHRGTIHSTIGGWIIGEAVYCHGYDMMEELIGKASYFQVLVLNITGRLPERRLAECIEAIFLCVSYPDSRIWCNQIGSLGGTLRSSPVAAACAGILASDSRMYGAGTLLAGIELTKNVVKLKRSGMTVEDIIKSYQRTPKSPPVMIGFSRPIASGDERIETLDQTTKQLGFERGEHLALAYEIQEILLQKTGEGMNLLGYIAPFFCDQGFTPQEIYRLVSIMVNSGVLACYAEAADNPPESFFPLHCNDIDYQGPASRPVPDKE